MVFDPSQLDHDALAGMCRKWGIAELSLFGSVLRDDFRPDSDIDVMVQFEPQRTPGWEIVDLQAELSELFGGRRVDLVNRKHLNPRLRDRVLRSAVVQYEASNAA